jgi:hypothetical protein
MNLKNDNQNNMLKKITLLLFVLTVGSVQAQTDTLVAAVKDTTWQAGGLLAISFNQTTLTNWAAGGQNSVALSGVGAFYLKYRKDSKSWETNLDVAYGLIKQDGNDFQKNDDRIELNSKYGYKAFHSSHWYYTALLNAKTQFTEGYNYPNDSVVISNFAAPAYGIFALGLDYKPTSYFNVFVSPLTAKITVVNDQTLADQGAFGVDPAEFDPVTKVKVKDGSTLRTEYGAYLNARFQKDIMTNVNLMAKLDLFSNYENNPANIDVNFDLLLGMKINKLITVSLGVTVIYDDDIMIEDGESAPGVPKVGPRTQLRQTFGVGLAKKF